MAPTESPSKLAAETARLAPSGLPLPRPSDARNARNAARAAHRVRLCYRDEAYRQRTEARTKCLMADASSASCSSTSALLARKALKYRKVFDRMTGVDVTDPNFDVFEFLGVDWCKSASVDGPV